MFKLKMSRSAFPVKPYTGLTEQHDGQELGDKDRGPIRTKNVLDGRI